MIVSTYVCDRCGATEVVESPLPNGWATVEYRVVGEVFQFKHLCPICVGEFDSFLRYILVPGR
jgi:hypothetical protein